MSIEEKIESRQRWTYWEDGLHVGTVISQGKYPKGKGEACSWYTAHNSGRADSMGEAKAMMFKDLER